MKKPVLLPPYRSDLESKMGDQLEAAGLPFTYETEKLTYVVPGRTARYTPDFLLTKLDGTTMYLETKGRFGGGNPRTGSGSSSCAAERQKMILVKEQHPDLDIRFVFSNASTPIYKGSPTTHAKWASTHGFLWADKGLLPLEWIKEIKA